VAFRLILAIPHFIVLYALGIAASVVVIIGWFGALATGRLPLFAATYLSGYVRWYCRTMAYLLLLTDKYPPFEFDDTAYPVRMAVSPGKLSRLVVLFRIILAIPAGIVSLLLLYGVSTIVVFIAWLTALVAGRLPASLHQAFAAVLRYSIRYYGYMYLLTDAYPAGLFGDKPGTQATAPLPGGPGYGPLGGPGYGASGGPDYGPPGGPSFGASGSPGYGPPGGPSFGAAGGPGYGAPGGPGYGASGGPAWGAPNPQQGGLDAWYGAPGYGTPPPPADQGAPGRSVPGYGTPLSGYGAPAGYQAPGYAGPSGYGTPPVPGYGAPAAGAAGPEPSWQLVLLPGARRLLGLILVLGLLAAFGGGFVIGTTINAAVTRNREINQLEVEITQHNAAVARYETAVARQQQAAGQVSNAVEQVSAANQTLDAALNSPDSDSSNCSTVNCFNVTALPVANAFAAFGRTLHATPMPPGAAAIAKRLSTDTAANEQDWKEITTATSFTSIEDIATAAETVGGHFDNDYPALIKALNQEATTLDGQATTLDGQAAALNQGAAALVRQAAALNVTLSVRTADAPSSTAA
jgi:hypothetical protein